MQAELFGEGLLIEQKPGALRLIIQPKPSRMVPDAWLFLGILLLLLVAIGIGLYLWIGTPLSALRSGDRSDPKIWAIWFVITGFVVCIPIMIKSRGWKRKIFIARQPDDGEQILLFRIRWPFSFSRLRCPPDEIQRLRLHSGHPGVWRRNDKDKHVFAKAHWWLLFETTNDVQYSINLPVGDEHVHRLAGMLGEVFGQEFRVMQSVTEAEVSEADMPTRQESGT